MSCQLSIFPGMSLELADLNDATRKHMLAELERDIQTDKLYLGKYLSEAGETGYPKLLQEAIESGTDDSLAVALTAPGLFKSHYQRKKPSGGFTSAKVPHTANLTLAEGEFNRFYLRGLCLRLLENGSGKVEIYRARESSNPRAESEALIGRHLEPAALLEDLRANTGVDTALGLPPGPNSGLSGRIPSA
jgi:hypothetical protein